MKECIKCNVKVASHRKTCPLCSQILKNENDQDQQLVLYPKYPSSEKKLNVFLKIIQFLSITSILITVGINILTYVGDWWSFYVVLGVVYLWILFRITILSKRNIAGRLFIQMIALSLSCVGIEYFSKSDGWALEYVVPLLCVATTIAISILILIKQMRYNDYLLYLLTMGIILWIPMILYWTKVINILWPSITAAALSIVTIFGMIIFADRATKDELKKRFHL